MNKHSILAPAFLLSTVGLACLATGCAPQGDAPGAAQVASAENAAPAAGAQGAGGAGNGAVPAAQGSRAVADGSTPPSLDPANQRGGKRYEGGIPRLETGHDLSKVATPANGEAEGHHADDGHDHDHDHATEQAADGSSLTPAGQAQQHAGRFELADGTPQVKEFGKLRQGEVGHYDFVFVSGGKEPLVITGVKPSCGCTKADLVLLAPDGTKSPYTKGDPIPVGQKFALESEINTDGRQGAFNTQVALYGNDSRGAFNVRLTADVEPVLKVSPSPTVFFGRVTTKDAAEQKVTVETTRGEPFALDFANEQELDHVTVAFTAKEPDAQGKSSQWEITVALQPGSMPGMKSIPIQLNSDLVVENPKYPSQDGSPQYHGFMLNVQAQILGMVSAEPPFLTFGMVKPGESIERSLRLESHDDFKLTSDIPVVIEGLQGQALSFADRFQITIEPKEEGKAADLKVHLTGLPADVNGSIGGQIRVKVGHPFMDEVAIRFSAVCRPGLPPQPPQQQPATATGGAPGGQQK